MGSLTLDTGPVNVRGLIRARYARVIWNDGTLYVLARDTAGKFHLQSIAVAEYPTRPETANGYWVAQAEGGTVSFTRRGCATCGGKYRPLKQVSLDAIFSGSVGG